MNKFVVLVLVGYLCAVAHSYNDEAVFVPNPLPCAFQIKADSVGTFVKTGESAGETTVVYSKHGGYFRQKLHYYMSETDLRDTDSIIRTDLKKKESGKDVFEIFDAVNSKSNDDSCDASWKTKEQIEDSLNTTLKIFITTQKFETKEKDQFRGKDCYIYSLKEDEHVLKYFVDMDNYLFRVEEIFKDQAGDLVNSTADIEYVFSASLGTFVIDKAISSKCDKDAYSSPTQATCPDDYTFEPHPLPCAYQITANSVGTMVETGKQVGTTDAIFSGHGTYFRAQMWFKEEGKNMSTKDMLVRTDLTKKDGKQVLTELFQAVLVQSNDSCTSNWTTDQQREQFVNQTISIFVNSKKFDKLEKATFKGTTYDCYSLEEGKHILKYYVDDDDYIYGMEEVYEDQYGDLVNTTVTISYKFEAQLNVFLVDKAVSSQCADDAYKAPSQKLCSDASSSGSTGSSNAGIATTVSIVLVVFSIMLSFISLF